MYNMTDLNGWGRSIEEGQVVTDLCLIDDITGSKISVFIAKPPVFIIPFLTMIYLVLTVADQEEGSIQLRILPRDYTDPYPP